MFLGQAQGSDLVNLPSHWCWGEVGLASEEDVKGEWGGGKGTVRESCTFRARSQKGWPSLPQHHETFYLSPHLLLSPCPRAIFLPCHSSFSAWSHENSVSPSVCHSSHLQWGRTPLSPPGWLPVKSYLLAHGTSIPTAHLHHLIKQSRGALKNLIVSFPFNFLLWKISKI